MHELTMTITVKAKSYERLRSLRKLLIKMVQLTTTENHIVSNIRRVD